MDECRDEMILVGSSDKNTEEEGLVRTYAAGKGKVLV
jgi:hypothetical protein